MISVKQDNLLELHGACVPAEIRAESGTWVEIVQRGYPEPKIYKMGVWRMSPIGIEICRSETTPSWDLGTELQIVLTLSNTQRVNVAGAVVAHVEDDNQSLIAIRFLQTHAAATLAHRQRQDDRWNCAGPYVPTGTASNPVRFNDFIYFTVRNISRSGMNIATSLRNQHLCVGVTLDSIVSFPSIGQAPAQIRVVQVKISPKDMSIGVEFIDPSKTLLQLAGQYLLQFGADDDSEAPGVSALRAAGLDPLLVSKALDFDYVRSEDDYKQVCALRQQAYARVAKDGDVLRPQDWSDDYDSRARILIATHKRKVIGSIRVIFSEDDEHLETERYIKKPANWPSNSNVVEVSRMCTDPSYRQGDLLIKLIAYAMLVILQSKRSHVIANCTNDLLRIYNRVGIRRTGETFDHKLGGGTGLKHFVIMGNIPRIAAGLDVGPLIWTALFFNQRDFLKACEPLTRSRRSRRRLALYRLVAPIFKLFLSLTSRL